MAEPTKTHHYVLGAALVVALLFGGITFFPQTTAKQVAPAADLAPLSPAAGTEQLGGIPPQPTPVINASETQTTPTIEPNLDENNTNLSESVNQPAKNDALEAELAKADPAWAQPRGNKIGNPNALVKIKEFASLSCSHCAHFKSKFFPDIKKKYVDTGKVEFEFIEFPLNASALDGTLVLNCLPKESYYSFMTLLFETQEHWAFAQDHLTPLRQNAKLAGLSDAKFDACIKDEAARKKLVEQNIANTNKYKIESTPTFVINEGAQTILGARPLEGFAEKIDPLLNQKK